MNSISNRFAALDMDRNSPSPPEGARSPPYPPTPLTAAEIAYVRKLDAEMNAKASGRFRNWTRDSSSDSSSAQNIFGGNRRQQQQQSRAHATPTVRQEDIAASEGKYRPPVFRQAIIQAKKSAPLDTANAEQFPSLGGGSAPKKTWAAATSGGQTFAKKVADLAERELNDEIRRRLEEEEDERRRMRETVVIPFSNRFRRPLEAVLTDYEDEDNGMDQGFEDDHYDPSTHYEGAGDDEEEN